MKKLVCIGLLLFSAFSMRSQEIISYPQMTGRNTNSLVVEQIERYSDRVIFYVSLYGNGGNTLNSSIYLQDANSPQRFELSEASGYPVNEIIPAQETEHFVLTFNNVPSDVTRVHLTEGSSPLAYTLQGIRLSNPSEKELAKAERVPSLIEFPEVSGRNTDQINIDRIEHRGIETVLTLTLTGNLNEEIYLRPELFLRDNYSFKSYKLRYAEEAQLNEPILLKTGWKQIRLHFEPLAAGTRTVDFVNDPGNDRYSIWGIHITQKGILGNAPECKTIDSVTIVSRDCHPYYIRKIELTNQQALFHMHAAGREQYLKFPSNTYLQDNFSGRRYYLKNLDTYPTDRSIKITPKGADFVLEFEPIQKGTRTLDLIMGTDWNAKHIWGIGINELTGKSMPAPPSSIEGKRLSRNPKRLPLEILFQQPEILLKNSTFEE